jgi:hypothetical protein
MRMQPRFALIAVTAAALVGGCRRAGNDPVPATLPGSYVYAARGSTFRKPWRFAARLELTPNRRYTFTLNKSIDGNADSSEINVGTYSVSGNHILLSENERGPANSQDVHKLLIKADSLIAEVGWTAELFIKGVGAPNIVFVKERRG